MVADYDSALAAVVNHFEFDERQPTLWNELAMLKNRAVLLVRGENSLLMNQEISQKMKSVVHGMVEYTATAQAHAPMLHAGLVTEKIHEFLAALDDAALEPFGGRVAVGVHMSCVDRIPAVTGAERVSWRFLL